MAVLHHYRGGIGRVSDLDVVSRVNMFICACITILALALMSIISAVLSVRCLLHSRTGGDFGQVISLAQGIVLGGVSMGGAWSAWIIWRLI